MFDAYFAGDQDGEKFHRDETMRVCDILEAMEQVEILNAIK